MPLFSFTVTSKKLECSVFPTSNVCANLHTCFLIVWIEGWRCVFWPSRRFRWRGWGHQSSQGVGGHLGISCWSHFHWQWLLSGECMESLPASLWQENWWVFLLLLIFSSSFLLLSRKMWDLYRNQCCILKSKEMVISKSQLTSKLLCCLLL